MQKQPNDAIATHELYQDYCKKINGKNEQEKWNAIIALEQEKLLYFILAYPQQIVLVKTGDKNEEKAFLGYEFSNRRGSEGIHPMQRGKSIDQCTKLFDPETFENPERASTYIYNAFQGNHNTLIAESLQENITRHRLVDMLTFDRVEFEKGISLVVKKKVRFEDIWGTDNLESLNVIAEIKKGTSITKDKTVEGDIPVIAGGQEPAYFHNQSNREGKIITVSASGAYAGFVNYFNSPIFASDCNTIKSKDESIVTTKLIFHYLKAIQSAVYQLQRGQAQPHVYAEDLSKIKIPLPPIDIQEKIVAEIEALEEKDKLINEEVEKLRNEINAIIDRITSANKVRLQEITTKIGSGATPLGGESAYIEKGITLIRSQNIYDNRFVEKGLAFIDEEQAIKLNNVTVLENDILFNITGASVCRCSIVESKYLPARVNQHVSIIRTNEKVLPKYLQRLLVSSKIKAELLAIAESSSTREAITKAQLEDFKIPLVSISEQRQIVSQITAIEVQIAAMEKELEIIPQQKEAVLKKYL